MIGRTLGTYRILREIEHGGMATVYLAEDLKHARQVAVKVLKPELAASVGPLRFLREIATTASLTNPHILPLFDSGSGDDVLYYVTPFIDGESLRARLRREGRLPIDDALRFVRDVATALDYAHDRGFLHRDIKPENILLAGQEAMLADFGIAGALRSGGGSGMTETGNFLGTIGYMSPEQVAGEGRLDRRSDVYSLGCVLYELLAGRAPFISTPNESVLYQHIAAKPPDVREVRPEVPGPIAAAIQRCLSKNPADRFDSAGHFVAAWDADLRVDSGRHRQPRHLWLPGLAIIAIAVAAIVILARTGSLRGLTGAEGHRGAVAATPWILVATFESPVEEPTIGAAARDVVTGLLSQSRIVSPVPDEQVAVALEKAGHPDTTRIGPELARELAERSTVRSILRGRVQRLGSGYSILLQVVDVTTGAVLATSVQEARGQTELVASLERGTRRILDQLAKRQGSLQPVHEAISMTTSSFAAFMKMREGFDRASAGDKQGALRLAREAVTLDPQSADCWTSLAFGFWNVDLADSALIALREAQRLQGPAASESDRAYLEAYVQELQGNIPMAIRFLDRAIESNPTDWGAIANRAQILAEVGRSDEAIAGFQLADRIAPFGPSQTLLGQEFETLLLIGKFTQAELTATRLDVRTPLGRNAPLVVRMARGNWAGSEQEARRTAADPAAPDDVRLPALMALASTDAASGALEASWGRLREALAVATRTRSHGEERFVLNELVFLGMSYGEPSLLPEAPLGPGASDADSALAGIMEVIRGRRERARRLLGALDARPRSNADSPRPLRDHLAARLALAGGNSTQAIALLTRHLEDPRNGSAPWARAMRWSLADAYESRGNPDSAATVLAAMLTLERPRVNAVLTRGMGRIIVACRIAALSARAGQVEAAGRTLEEASKEATRPDARARQLLASARQATGQDVPSR